MSNNCDDQRLIAEFLGEEAAIGGPFALLGLKHEPISSAKILGAFEQRLRAINTNKRSQTTLADEVRLAVHAAASQLLDPELRAELTRLWPEGVGVDQIPDNSPVAWRAESQNPLDDKILQQAFQILGSSGGWNAKSRTRLGYFARRHRISATKLLASLVGGTASHSCPPGNERSRHASPMNIQFEMPDSLSWFVFPVLYSIMGIALIFAGYSTWESPGPEQSSVLFPGSNPENLVDRSSMNRPDANTELQERRHYSSIIHELQQFLELPVQSVDEATRFSSVGERLCSQWTEFTQEELRRSLLDLRSVLHGIQESENLKVSIMFLAAPKHARQESLLKAVLRAWLFNQNNGQRLSRQTQLKVSDNGLQDLDRSFEDTFQRLSSLGSDDPQWWAWWKLQHESQGIAGERYMELAWLNSVYQRLVDSKATNDQWRQCCKIAVSRGDWGNDGAARLWLMNILVDPEVRSDRLAVYIQALALYSSVRAVDIQDLLSSNASMKNRNDYMKALRDRWEVDSAPTDAVRQQLMDELRRALLASSGAVHDEQRMIRCVELARVNSACWLRWTRDDAKALAQIDRFDSPVLQDLDQRLELDLSSDSVDEQWATIARNLTDATELVDHLDGVRSAGEIGPKSAHALVYLAMQAPDLGVRRQAEITLLSFPDHPAVLIALDRTAGAKRTTRRMLELIRVYLDAEQSTLEASSVRKEIFRRMIRVGMINSLDFQTHNRSADQAYEDQMKYRAGDEATAKPFREGYSKSINEFTSDGLKLPLEVETRLGLYLRHANGPVQEAVAYRWAMIELLARQVMADADILSNSANRLRLNAIKSLGEAKDASSQLLILERTESELWILMLNLEGMS